jgi:type I restriction enzyme S subunit
MVKINQAAIRRTVFPLPPHTEQRRIVAKVDQLMALRNELEAKLTQAQADAETLAASIVHYLCNPNTNTLKGVAS